MVRKHKMLNLAVSLIWLISLFATVNSPAASKDNSPDAGVETFSPDHDINGVDASGEIIPGDRRIDWSYAGIPGGIPERTVVCATINSAVYGNGATDATGAIQDAIDNCPDGQVVFLPQGTYLVYDTIHLDDYETLRGAGMGKSIIKHTGGYSRSIVDMRGSIYYQIASLYKIYNVLAANKDSRVVTLSKTSGIAPGDILLINQLNDNVLVDPVGVEGKCTYCGYENGDRVLGQLVEVTAVNANQVTLNLPLHWTYNPNLTPWAYQVDASAMIRNAGLEDLTLTQDDPDVEFMIEMDGAQYSWIKNVEIKNIQRRAMWVINSLQMRSADVTSTLESTDTGATTVMGFSLTCIARTTWSTTIS